MTGAFFAFQALRRGFLFPQRSSLPGCGVVSMKIFASLAASTNATRATETPADPPAMSRMVAPVPDFAIPSIGMLRRSTTDRCKFLRSE
jgi:hypothetical protein